MLRSSDAVVAWAERYKRVNRSTGVAVSGGGTGTGIAALLNGTIDIASASREMTSREIRLAKKHGIAPVLHIVGYDAVAIYLHKDNPLNSLSFSQLADIYAQGGKRNAGQISALRCPAAPSRKLCG